MVVVKNEIKSGSEPALSKTPTLPLPPTQEKPSVLSAAKCPHQNSPADVERALAVSDSPTKLTDFKKAREEYTILVKGLSALGYKIKIDPNIRLVLDDQADPIKRVDTWKSVVESHATDVPIKNGSDPLVELKLKAQVLLRLSPDKAKEQPPIVIPTVVLDDRGPSPAAYSLLGPVSQIWKSSEPKPVPENFQFNYDQFQKIRNHNLKQFADDPAKSGTVYDLFESHTRELTLQQRRINSWTKPSNQIDSLPPSTTPLITELAQELNDAQKQNLDKVKEIRVSAVPRGAAEETGQITVVLDPNKLKFPVVINGEVTEVGLVPKDDKLPVTTGIPVLNRNAGAQPVVLTTSEGAKLQLDNLISHNPGEQRETLASSPKVPEYTLKGTTGLVTADPKLVDGLVLIGEGARKAEEVFGLTPGSKIKELVVVNSVRENGYFTSLRPEAIHVTDEIIRRPNAATELPIVGKHETFHALDYAFGFSSSQEFIKGYVGNFINSTSLTSLNEKNHFPGMRAGHAESNEREAFASLMNLVTMDDAPTRIAGLDGRAKDLVKTLCEAVSIQIVELKKSGALPAHSLPIDEKLELAINAAAN